MRFWITKNSELPVREQLVRQVLLGILSEDLPAGHKLPSVRALARRHQIHANTVSAAYHDLLERGWLELRRGSGLFVRPLQSASGDGQGLDQMLTAVLQAAKGKGYEPDEVLLRLEHLVRPRSYERVVIAEPDPAMREILRVELSGHLSLPVDAVEEPDPAKLDRSVVVALPTRAAKLGDRLPKGVPCISLRLRSVREALEGQVKPPPNVVIAIVSHSQEIRLWARAVLIAVGLEPDCVCEVDTEIPGWQERLNLASFAVTDVVAAGELPPSCLSKVFRVIADSFIAELKQFCGG